MSKYISDELDEILKEVYDNGADSVLVSWKSNSGTKNAKQAILNLIDTKVNEARIDELENLKNNFKWGNGTDDIDDRLATLKAKENK